MDEKDLNTNGAGEETTKAEAGQQTRNGARITLPTEHMVRTKSASGGISFHCGDAVAQALAGLTLAHVKTLAAEGLGIDTTKYDHLNPGQQRMTLGNLIRNMTRRDESLIEPFNTVLVRVQNLAEQEAAEKAERDRVANEAKEKVKREANEAKAKKKADAEQAKKDKEAEKQRKADEKEAEKQRKADEKQKKADERAQAKKDKEAEKQRKADEKEAEKQRKAAEKQQKAAAAVGGEGDKSESAEA